MIECKDLVTKNRIDIVIGIQYVDYYEHKYRTNFFIDLYIAHKRAFNNLSERNCKTKESFIKRFNNLIDSIKKHKTNFEPIPVYKFNNE